MITGGPTGLQRTLDWTSTMQRLKLRDIKERVYTTFCTLYPEYKDNVVFTNASTPLDFRDIYSQEVFNDICGKLFALHLLLKDNPEHDSQVFGITMDVEISGDPQDPPE